MSCLLGLRLRDWLGQLVERTRASRLVSVPWTWTFGFERRLGNWSRDRCGGKGDRGVHLRHYRPEGLVFDQCRRRHGCHGPVLFHDGIYGYHGHDSDRRYGGALGMEELLLVWPMGRAALLSLCELGVGRRLACSRRSQLGLRSWSRRLCRLRCCALDGWGHCSRGGIGSWAAIRQV